MNYRDFFKNKRVTRKDILSLLPEGVDQKEFDKGIGTEKEHTDDEFTAAKIAGDHLKEDPKYYTKLSDAGLEEEDVDECGTCGCGDPSDDHSHEEEGYDDNGGLPKLGGALAVPHRGQPIMMGKIIQVGGIGGGPANGELGGMKNAQTKDKGVPATQPGDKEPITAGGKPANSSVASKSVGGNIVPGEGQEQGGPNSSGTIAGTSKLNESKEKVRKIVKNVLKEIKFDRASGKWVKLNEGHKAGCKCAFCSNKGSFGKKDKEEKEDVDETVDMKMGKSYKTVQPRMYDVQSDDRARTNQYTPDITEMYDDEEECMMNERYVELANAQRNLKESELAEMKVLREKIDKIALTKRNFGLSPGGTEPNLFEDDKWIQKAVDPKHKGYCTPMSKSTCTPARKALAKRFKSGDLSEEETMKMGPSYKTVQPTLAKTSKDNFARKNQFDPQVSEAGIGAVQHSSYRTVDHGNLPTKPKQRWADDLDEASKKPSKVVKTITKGQKPATTKKDSKLKFKAAKKTTSGVHKRKT